MLTVAPRGRAVETTAGLMPRFSSATRIATGRVAMLDEVEKATSMASVMPRKKGITGSQAISLTTRP